MAKTERDVKHLLKKYRLEHHADHVLSSLEPAYSIELRPQRTKAVPVGRSKFGGLPHLPEDFAWPMRRDSDRPLMFLAQLNLAEVPSHPAAPTDLPEEGWLHFWWDQLWWWEDQNIHPPDHPGEFQFTRVTFVADPDADLVRTPFPVFAEPKLKAKQKPKYYRPPNFGPENERRIVCHPAMSIQKDACTELFKRADDMVNPDAEEDEWTRVLDFEYALHGHTDAHVHQRHLLLGSISEAQEDMREQAQEFYAKLPGVRTKIQRNKWGGVQLTARQRSEWTLLLALGSDSRIKRDPERLPRLVLE